MVDRWENGSAARLRTTFTQQGAEGLSSRRRLIQVEVRSILGDPKENWAQFVDFSWEDKTEDVLVQEMKEMFVGGLTSIVKSRVVRKAKHKVSKEKLEKEFMHEFTEGGSSELPPSTGLANFISTLMKNFIVGIEGHLATSVQQSVQKGLKDFQKSVDGSLAASFKKMEGSLIRTVTYLLSKGKSPSADPVDVGCSGAITALVGSANAEASRATHARDIIDGVLDDFNLCPFPREVMDALMLFLARQLPADDSKVQIFNTTPPASLMKQHFRLVKTAAKDQTKLKLAGLYVEKLYFPFCIDKQHWIGVCVDMKASTVAILDSNVSFKSESLMKKELNPIANLMPYIIIAANGLEIHGSVKPFSVNRLIGVTQILNPGDAAVMYVLLTEAHANSGLEGIKGITARILPDAAKQLVVNFFNDLRSL
ncbi:hypothetical protein N665_0610s0002 [Sinapis alba]|nr:hypothetical protein N665_0610s0002 [Sinapis alba]